MATPQLSPGVLVREVDLTVGRADNVLDNIGAIAGPFPIGPVNYAVDIATEQDLINTFGKPSQNDNQYEYWMSASSYLSYGGVLKVIRTKSPNLNNANAGVGIGSTASLDIDNYDDYNAEHTEAQNFTYAAKNPGTWANGLKVCVIDDLADQVINVTSSDLSSDGVAIGYGVTANLNGISIPGSGTFTGYLKGIITGVTTAVTGSNSSITVKVVSRVSSGGTETKIDYAEGTEFAAFKGTQTLNFIDGSGSYQGNLNSVSVSDWYNQQKLGLENSTIFWSSIAPKPTTSIHALNRNGKGDGIHVVVVDDKGTITQNPGTILEKHVGLSKALDAISAVNSPQRIYYKQFLADYSSQIYAGKSPSSAADGYWRTAPRAVSFTKADGTTQAFIPNVTENSPSKGDWGQNAQDVTFSAVGNVTYALNGGQDYGANGSMAVTLADLQTSYNLFSNKDDVQVDYLIMGPGLTDENDSIAKAQYLISIAGQRKDCVAVIGPHRGNLIGQSNSTTQTTNLIKYFNSVGSSSSYAIFDSGYKYTYDRFNNDFVYLPCNSDVAGLMARTSERSYPWYSPAGSARGSLNNVVKLAYNPSQAQRDELYSRRINPIIASPGAGFILFGDKTALSYASAFDRINVRRLFLTIEKAIEGAARAQLFEFNDLITRTNFVNIVEPYLRDIKAKRGITEFVVVCDETNNTPDVIDSNQLRADIFIKPARSINFIGLTFVATRTGVSFEEVVGTV